jgi:hypothetical protein
MAENGAVIVDVGTRHKLLMQPGDLGMDFELVEEVTSNGKPDTYILIEGRLKWDGCMDWETSRPVMYHFCDLKDALVVLKAFELAYAHGPKLISC